MPRAETHFDAGQPGEPVVPGPKVRASDVRTGQDVRTAHDERGHARSGRRRSFDAAARSAVSPDATRTAAPHGTRFGAPRGAPLPNRPKGRFFVGLLLWSLLGGASFVVWDTFFRYEAHGLVTGRVVTVGAPWDGVVKALHLREGEAFRHGELLVTMENLELRQELEQLHDRLRLAQAQLEAKIAELKYKTQLDDDRTQKASAELYELWGNVLRERATLLELRATKDRYAKIPRDSDIIANQERERVEIAERGQTDKVKKMIDALRQLQKRVAGHSASGRHREQEQLQPEIVQVDRIQKQIAHLRSRLQQGEVRASVDGQVLKRLHFTGEHVQTAEGLCEVLEEGSKELVLFVAQETLADYQLDQLLPLRIEPLSVPVRCRIVRIGDVLQPAPTAIDHYYRQHAQLVPIHLRPEAEGYEGELRIGCEIKLPARRGTQIRAWCQELWARAKETASRVGHDREAGA